MPDARKSKNNMSTGGHNSTYLNATFDSLGKVFLKYLNLYALAGIQPKLCIVMLYVRRYDTL